jgi:tetratricopeptide (TPR) repeat protein
MKLVAALGMACVAGLLVACRSSTASVGPYTPPSAAARDTTKAEGLNREAADLLESDHARAEDLLRQALTADIFFGPAHNNLGVLFLKQEKLYEAAGEFEWAKKLMPGHPDPRVNLAPVLELAGRTDEALASYEAALEVWPGYLPALQGLASLSLRSGRRDDPRLAGWLEEVALRGETEWRDWARGEVIGR